MNLNDSLQDAITLLRSEGQHDLADAVVVAAVVVVLSASDKKQSDSRERAAAHLYVESLARRASEHDGPSAQAAGAVVKQDLTTQPAQPKALQLRHELRERVALTELAEVCEDMRAAAEECDIGEGLAHAVPFHQWNEFLSKLDDAATALAATGKQQVGGVQGDAWVIAESLGGLVVASYGERGNPMILYRDQMELLQAALAARQPVGQKPVGLAGPFLSDVVTAAGLLSTGGQSKALASRISDEAFRLLAMLHAAPTAQAVDLGPVRAALQAAEGLCVCCASVDGYSRNELHAFGVNMRSQFRDALTLVDAQAVQS